MQALLEVVPCGALVDDVVVGVQQIHLCGAAVRYRHRAGQEVRQVEGAAAEGHDLPVDDGERIAAFRRGEEEIIEAIVAVADRHGR